MAASKVSSSAETCAKTSCAPVFQSGGWVSRSAAVGNPFCPRPNDSRCVAAARFRAFASWHGLGCFLHFWNDKSIPERSPRSGSDYAASANAIRNLNVAKALLAVAARASPFLVKFAGQEMTRRFNVGDHVAWNSEAGRVTGKIIRVHTRDTEYKGYRRRASREEPQYEIRSDKTDHIAMHKASALKLMRSKG